MHSPAPKQSQLNERLSASLTRSKASTPEPVRRASMHLKLARTIGNRAVGQLLARTARGPQSQSQSARRRDESNNGNRSGLPKDLKAGVENLSGLAMDDVKVHYNSAKPGEVRALAHTQGSNIYIGPGQEKHLPHEAWHVVQQRQGRVNPTGVQSKGASINDHPGLEREADQMGAAALKANSPSRFNGGTQSPRSESPQPQVAQRKKVPETVGPTDFGQFETTTFNALEGKGVEIELKFHPQDSMVDAKKIAFSQSVKTTTPSGTAYAIDPNSAKRMVASGKSGAGYYTDQLSDVDSPLYADDVSLGAGKDLKDTPLSSIQIGYCYKEKPDAAKKKRDAFLSDKPKSGKDKGRSKTFETAALAVDGADAGKYYGSVKWGYKMEGTDAAPTVTKSDIEPVSKGTPSANFMEPAKLWNLGKTRGTIEVTADPEATVLKSDASTEKLAKGTKLTQLATLPWPGGAEPAIKAEVVKVNPKDPVRIIYIKVSDVKDVGDGSDNKKLPVPADKPAVKK